MLNKLFSFKQKSKTKLSNHEVFSFVNYLISLEYKIKFINELADLINNGVELDKLVLFKNSKNKQLSSRSPSILNEDNCKDLKAFGNFDSILPNKDIYDLNLLYALYKLGNDLIKDVKHDFYRDWSLKNITKTYLDSGFDKALDFTINIFKREISKLGYPELIKAIGNHKDNIIEKRELYKKFYNEINSTEIIGSNRKKEHIHRVLGKINDSNFPQLLYFDLDSKEIKNYAFNDFNYRKDFDIKKVTHESPWVIDVLAFSKSEIYIFIAGTIALIASATAIRKNINDIRKTKREKKEKHLNKLQDFLDKVEKSESVLSSNIKNIQKIESEIIKTELLETYENFVFEFSREIKKLKFEITISDIENVE